MADVLRSIPGIGPIASSMLIAEMPQIGTITGQEAAALTGLAPVAHDSETLRGKQAIAGGRRALRHVMSQTALVPAHHNPSLRPSAERLRKPAKPHKVIITAVASKRHHRARPAQESSQMAGPNGLTDTVANLWFSLKQPDRKSLTIACERQRFSIPCEPDTLQRRADFFKETVWRQTFQVG